MLTLCVLGCYKITTKAKEIDLKARGQAYDGASAMSSNISGVIPELAPLAVYTHCRSHVLNLSIAATCQLPEVRNMIDGINSTFLFFHNSPKRQKFLRYQGCNYQKKVFSWFV